MLSYVLIILEIESVTAVWCWSGANNNRSVRQAQGARSFSHLILFRRPLHHSRSASRRRSLSTSLCWLQSRRAAADPNYCGPTSARDDVRARRAAARPAGACVHAGDSSCSSKSVRHLAACREAAASTASTSRRPALPAWRSARPERGLRRQVARALPRRRGGSLGSSRAGRR